MMRAFELLAFVFAGKGKGKQTASSRSCKSAELGRLAQSRLANHMHCECYCEDGDGLQESGKLDATIVSSMAMIYQRHACGGADMSLKDNSSMVDKKGIAFTKSTQLHALPPIGILCDSNKDNSSMLSGVLDLREALYAIDGII